MSVRTMPWDTTAPMPVVEPAESSTTTAEVEVPVKVEVEASPAAVKQPTGHPTSKMAAVGIGGGALAVVIGWLQARFGIEFIEEDIALIMLIGPFVAGYFTKERR